MTAHPARVERTPTDHDRRAARLVHRAVAQVDGGGRFGERKVFVSALWGVMCRVDEEDGSSITAGCTLKHFQRWLFDSRVLTADGTDWGAPLVVLARADLVSAMDPSLVAASEWTTNGATYHFVIDSEADPTSYAARRPFQAPEATPRRGIIGASRTGGHTLPVAQDRPTLIRRASPAPASSFVLHG